MKRVPRFGGTEANQRLLNLQSDNFFYAVLNSAFRHNVY
jgi:hypothetical protein